MILFILIVFVSTYTRNMLRANYLREKLLIFFFLNVNENDTSRFVKCSNRNAIIDVAEIR